MLVLAVKDPLLSRAQTISRHFSPSFQKLSRTKKNQLTLKKFFFLFTFLGFLLNAWFVASQRQLILLFLVHAVIAFFWYVESVAVESRAYVASHELQHADQDYLLLVFFINLLVYLRNARSARKVLATALALVVLLLYAGSLLLRLSHVLLYPLFALFFTLYYHHT